MNPANSAALIALPQGFELRRALGPRGPGGLLPAL